MNRKRVHDRLSMTAKQGMLIVLLLLLAFPTTGTANIIDFPGSTCRDIANYFASGAINPGDILYLGAKTIDSSFADIWRYLFFETQIEDLVSITQPNIVLSGGRSDEPDGISKFASTGINMLISASGIFVTQLKNTGLIKVDSEDVTIDNVQDIRGVFLTSNAQNTTLCAISIKPFESDWGQDSFGIKAPDCTDTLEIIDPLAIHLTLYRYENEVRITPLLGEGEKSCIAIVPSIGIDIFDQVVILVDLPQDAFSGIPTQDKTAVEARKAEIRSCFFIGSKDYFTQTREGSENRLSPYCIVWNDELSEAAVCRKGIVYDPNTDNAEGQMDPFDPFNPDSFSDDGTFTHSIDSCAYEVQGCTFLKWNTEPDGTGTSYLPDDTVTTDTRLVLYAIWKQNTHTYQLTNSPGKPYDGNAVTFDPDAIVVDGGNVSWAALAAAGEVRYVWRERSENAYRDMEGAPTEIGQYQLVIQETMKGSWVDVEVFEFAINDAEHLIKLPEDVKTIMANAFEGNKVITHVYVQDDCAEIGAEAFKGCTRLKVIRLPKNCLITDTAFDGCTQLSIIAPEGGTTEKWAQDRNIPFSKE